MNHSPINLTISQALEGFILRKTAQGLSQKTVDSYRDILKFWAAHIDGDPKIITITSQDLKSYIVWITTEYFPVRKNGKKHPLSPKTTRYIYIFPSRPFFDGSVMSSSILFPLTGSQSRNSFHPPSNL